MKPIGIKTIALGQNALGALPRIVGELIRDGPIAVLTDSVPKKGAKIDLAGKRVVLGANGARVHADEATLTLACEEVKGSAGLVTVGSGTLADIGKAVSARLGDVPHVVVQTATSVNGFADDQSVLLVKGVKRTTPTRWPDALIADADVLAGAPPALNLAGVGDLMAMFTAPADWKLAHLLGMVDSYSETAVNLTRRHGDDVLAAAPRLAEGDREAATLVARVLTLSGISMGVAGTTAPASGMEHTVSHLIEMAMNRQGREAAFHGAQVGVACIVASALWARVQSRLRRGPRPRLNLPTAEVMEERVRDAFITLDPSGAMGEECWRLYSKKLARWHRNSGRLTKTDWPSLMNETDRLLEEPRNLAASLQSAGAPFTFSQLDPPVDAELVRWAVLNCHLMRDRFTVADLAFFAGMWEEADVSAVLRDAAV